MKTSTIAVLAGERGFLPAPTDFHAYPFWSTISVVCTGLLMVITLFFGVHHTRATRSPLFALVLLGAFAFPMFVEPLGDIIGATWYPADSKLVVGEFFGRPMPAFVFLFYLSGIPIITLTMYALMRAGASARILVGMWAMLAVPEIVGEMAGVRLHLMYYYGNDLFLGVPIPSIVQNGGFMVVIGWLMMALRPEDQPRQRWRWALVPFVAPFGLMVYAITATGGSYLLIHTQTNGPALWATTAGSVLFNVALPLLLVYNPLLEKVRARRTPSMAELGKALIWGVAPDQERQNEERDPAAPAPQERVLTDAR
jgi:hypothetical protein